MLESAIERLYADYGKGVPRIESEIIRIKRSSFGTDEKLAILANLRFDPAMTGIDAPDEPPICYATTSEGKSINFIFKRHNNDVIIRPASVRGRSCAYVVIPSRESGPNHTGPLLLLLPKGARYTLKEKKIFAEVVAHERFTHCATRLADHIFLSRTLPFEFCSNWNISLANGDLVALMIADGIHDNIVAQRHEINNQLADTILRAYVIGLQMRSWRGLQLPLGCLLELGPHSFSVHEGTILKSIVDVAYIYSSTADRFRYGFISGIYGALCNWILYNNKPLSKRLTVQIIRGENLTDIQRKRHRLWHNAINRFLRDQSVSRDLKAEVNKELRSVLYV